MGKKRSIQNVSAKSIKIEVKDEISEFIILFNYLFIVIIKYK